jgi:cytochrome P450
MAVQPRPACPVHERFDPLAEEFLADPYAIMAALPLQETPVFYAPAIDGSVVTRYADVEAVFLDPDTYSAAAAQVPLVPLVPEAAEILLAGGHRPQPSMVSLDPPAHTRLRRPTSRAFTPRRATEMDRGYARSWATCSTRSTSRRRSTSCARSRSRSPRR